jgi:hypothetical protein
VESQLIEVKKMKMQMIQFVSISNLIQMKLMEVIYRMKNMLNKEFQHFVESKFDMRALGACRKQLTVASCHIHHSPPNTKWIERVYRLPTRELEERIYPILGTHRKRPNQPTRIQVKRQLVLVSGFVKSEF